MAGFTVAIVAGLQADHPATTILLNAIGALFACQILGAIAGLAIRAAVREHLNLYIAANPLPGQGDGSALPAHPSQSIHNESTA